MGKKNVNINKFLAGAITATMVASAVAPVAAFADENEIDFSDVDKSSSHYNNIVKAAERGLMTGYQGKFNPLVDMTRGQVVKALGKYLVGQEGLSVDKYIEKHDLLNQVTPFHDVPADSADQELFKYSLVVKDAEAFTGDRGNLKASNNIKREQMSKVLVEAFNLKEVEGAEANVADMADVQEQYAGYVTILSQHEITIADDNKFRPKGNVTRQQMASFLNRSFDVIHEDKDVEEVVKSVTAIDATTISVVFEGVEEAVEITLDTELVDGENEVTFTYNEQEFTVTVNYKTPVTELVVESVKSINQTIANGKKQELTFEVDGEKYTAKTFNGKFGEEGYTVKFLYNKSSNVDTFGEDGTVTVADTGTFKYSVQVTDIDGKKIPTDAANAANFAEVEVKSDSVETVTEAKLSNDLTYVTMGEETVTFEATKGINGLGKEVLPADGGDTLTGVTFNRAESSDSTVAFVEGNNIVPVKVGKVTFDVYFTNVEEPVKVEVEIKEAQEADSMESIENLKVQTGEVTLPEVKVLDQYGEEMTATPKIKVTDKDNDEVKVNGGKVSLTEAGLYTVKVFASDDKDAKQLGFYTIETVKVDENTTPDAYELNFSKGEKDVVLDTLDIEKLNTVKIDVVGKVDGVKVATNKFHKNLEVKSNDEAVKATYAAGVITVAFVDGKTSKEGDVTITLANKEGSMVKDLQTATVKVVNTAAQITELTLADEKATALTAKVDSGEALKAANAITHFAAEDIESQLSAGKDADEDEIFKKAMVKEVKFIERVIDENAGKLTGKVHVILEAKYGGKTFVFDAEVSTKIALESAIITQEATDTVDQEIIFTFTEAVALKAEDEIKIGTIDATVASVTGNKVVVTVAQGKKITANTDAIITVKQKNDTYVLLEDVFFGEVKVTAIE